MVLGFWFIDKVSLCSPTVLAIECETVDKLCVTVR